MAIKISLFILALVILMFLGTSYYSQSNYNLLDKTIAIKKPSVEAEVKRINRLKKKIDEWEAKHKPQILRDGFNPLVTDKNRNEPPVKGGFINITYSAEPKLLNGWIDNSAIVSYITSYIYESLYDQDNETFEFTPKLAVSHKEEDIVWLKGKAKKNIFKEKGESNFLIGTIDKDKIVWNKLYKKKIDSLTIYVNGKARVIKGDDLRYKKEEKEKYIRAFDLGVIFTFKLRKDVKWHDGKPFTAEDVIFSMDTIKNPYIPKLSSLRNYYNGLKHWEAIDKYTIKLYFDKQYFQNFEIASGFSVLPKHIFKPKDQKFTEQEFAQYFTDHKANRMPVGTGPYYFPSELIDTSYKEKNWKDKRLTLVRHDKYYDKKKKAYLKKLIYYFIPTKEISFIELKNGNIDFAALKSEEIFENSNDKKFKSKYVKVIHYSPSYSYYAFNMKKIYFRDKRVRKAFTMLLDRERINKSLLYDLAKIVSGNQYYFSPYYNHNIKPYKYNRQKAIELLNEAGWIDSDGDGIRDKNGVPFSVELMYSEGSSNAKSFSLFLYEELKGVGIDFKLKKLEWSVFLEHLLDRKFDMCTLSWGTGLESDGYQIWHSSQWANKGSNFVGFNNKRADEIIEEVRRTLDKEKRKKLYFEFQEILHDEQPYLFLYLIPNKGAYNNRFRNVKFYRLRPGYDFTEWFVPKNLQTLEEKKAEEN